MNPREAAHRWADVWKRAWEALDTEPIVALYRKDAVVSNAPFREPLMGRDMIRAYVARVFGEEEAPEVHMGLPIVDGDCAAITWWAALREEGVAVTLAGTSLLRFDATGLVAEQRDTWNVTRGLRSPPADGGPFDGE